MWCFLSFFDSNYHEAHRLQEFQDLFLQLRARSFNGAVDIHPRRVYALVTVNETRTPAYDDEADVDACVEVGV